MPTVVGLGRATTRTSPSFPASIVGRQHGHTAKEFFEADGNKKEDVKMEF